MKSIRKKKIAKKADAIKHICNRYGCKPNQLVEVKENRIRWMFNIVAEGSQAVAEGKPTNGFPENYFEHVKQYRKETGADYISARKIVATIREAQKAA